MSRVTRWGILGTGMIAEKFAQGLSALPEAELVAVGSRSERTARAFAERLGIARAHASYGALADDPEIDVVYVATPHTLHRDNTLLCLDAGKAVLCEKPFALNANETQTMIRQARESGLFLMEAMWTRFLPLMGRVRELLEEGAIGEPRLLQVDFGFRTAPNPAGRLFNPALGGGALLDVGVYAVSLASLVFGTPSQVSSMAHLGETGVDEQSAALLGYETGAFALLAAAIRTTTPQEATLMGSEGWLRLHAPWWKPTKVTLVRNGQQEEIALPFSGNGYHYEAAEVGRCLREGRLESTIMPLDETLSVMRTLDEIRKQWGLSYPGERRGEDALR